MVLLLLLPLVTALLLLHFVPLRLLEVALATAGEACPIIAK